MGNLKSYLTVWKLLKMPYSELYSYFEKYRPTDKLIALTDKYYHKVDLKINCPEVYIHDSSINLEYSRGKMLKKSGVINANVHIRYRGNDLEIVPKKIILRNSYRSVIVEYDENGKLISLYDSERTSEPSK